MQNTDNNMDELFRKAADLYEPAPADSGWDEIAPHLSASSVIPLAASKRRFTKTNFLFIAFCLLLTCAYFYRHNYNLPATPATALHHKNLLQHSVENKKLPLSTTIKNKTEQRKKVSENFVFSNQISTSKHTLLPVVANSKSDVNLQINGTDNHLAFVDTSDFSSIKNVDSAQKFITKTYADSSGTASSAKKLVSAREKKFYLGFLAGTSFNQVRQQSYEKPGLNIGLFAGYKIKRKLSVEAGALFTTKNYYSSGKYFDDAKMPASMKVVSLKGRSNYIEFPVVAKYDFIKKQTSAAFVTTGVSSSLLTKESNNYVVQISGLQQNMNALYNHTSIKVLSSVHVGVGYQKTLQKNTTLRIEPYLNLPVKGSGIGNMRVMSAGIHVAATLPLH